VETTLKLQIVQDFLVLYQHLTNALTKQEKEREDPSQGAQGGAQRDPEEAATPVSSGIPSLRVSQHVEDTSGGEGKGRQVPSRRSTMSEEEETSPTSSGWRSLFLTSMPQPNFSASLPSLPSFDKEGPEASDPGKDKRSPTHSAPLSRRSSKTVLPKRGEREGEEDKQQQRSAFFEGIVEIEGWQKLLLDILVQVRISICAVFFSF
jgi:hypothetical protein